MKMKYFIQIHYEATASNHCYVEGSIQDWLCGVQNNSARLMKGINPMLTYVTKNCAYKRKCNAMRAYNSRCELAAHEERNGGWKVTVALLGIPEDGGVDDVWSIMYRG